FPVSIIDCANIVIFVEASSLGLIGSELKGEIDSNDFLLETLEQIRVEVGHRLGVIKDKALATPATNAIPKIAVISHPSEYTTITNRLMKADAIDIVARYFSMGVLHRAFAVSGAIALATAAKIPGTLASKIVPSTVGELRIGHPSGTIFVDADVSKEGDQWLVSRAAVGRTARRLMDGYAYVKTESLRSITMS
ncbi:MAG: PrpF domain-containing protein, partial [Desulfuromonadaceae bacterium]